MPARTTGWWDYQVLADPKSDRRGFGPKEYAIHESGGVADGYVVSRIKDGEWDDGLPDGKLEVTELVATSPEAWAELWRHCLDADLVSQIEAWRLPLDNPLLQLLHDPRRARRTVIDEVWLRLVDLPAALAGRSWTGTDRLVLDVRDDFCPDNAGRWSLDVTEGQATCERSDDAADIELDAEGLAAIYLCDTRPIGLRAAGRLRECRNGATERLDALVGVSVSPWTPEAF
jgi:predicted acetyltransferase